MLLKVLKKIRDLELTFYFCHDMIREKLTAPDLLGVCKPAPMGTY